ncbi:lactococcin family bacteriocin [Lactococcus protaetiae]|uniref:Lactococcin family bacteriocin n=1 Tax=Lactococcus protaetiae TaxID=2592653 RepID=A0A514Z7U4_9LACT|nr:lactococcin family bacteriocin [Lactococcus protaetiae]QDK70664.1 lactococcin family bacteriocin [Lactococcus protaetiae]
MSALKTNLAISTVLLSLIGVGIVSSTVTVNASTALTIKSAAPKQILSVTLSAGGQMAFPNAQGKLVVATLGTPSKSAPAGNLEFIENVSNGVLLYNTSTHKYVYEQTRGVAETVFYIIANNFAYAD